MPRAGSLGAQSRTRQLNCWALIERSKELKDRWVAHCLDVDVVTYGDSPKHAFEMVYEATVMVVLDDLNNEREPLLRRAPDELWEPLWGVVNNGAKFELDDWIDSCSVGDVRLAVHFIVPCVCVGEAPRVAPRPKLARCASSPKPIAAAI